MDKIITLASLYDYFSSMNQTVHFSAKESNNELLVRAPGKIKFDETKRHGMLSVELKACHVGKNRNGSSISFESMNKALPSFYARPILGYIHYVDGKPEFKSHEMRIDEDDSNKIVYEEIPVGVVTSECGTIQYDEIERKHYAYVDGVIWEDYTEAADIMRRDGEEDCSVELCIFDLSYDAKEKSLLLNDFVFTGVTILGKDEDGNEIEPGMKGASIKISNGLFTISDGESVPTEFSNNKISEERRTTKVAKAKKDLLESNGATEVKSEEVEQEAVFDDDADEASDDSGTDNGDSGDSTEGNDPDLSNQDDDPAEDVPDNDPEPIIEETNEEELSDGDVTSDLEPEPVVDAPVEAPVVGAGEDGDDNEGDAEEGEEVVASNDDASTAQVPKKRKVEINGRTFELSLTAKAYAIEDLVNATYADADNDYYFCEVYDSFVIMKPWFGGQHYKQGYIESDEDVFSLVGERVKVFAEYLTEAEREALNLMRATYADLKRYKEDNENAKIEAEKNDVFRLFEEHLEEDPDYIQLKKDRAKYSVTELELQCNAIMGKRAVKFALSEKQVLKPNTVKIDFKAIDSQTAKKPYGGLFDDKKKK